MGVLSFISSIQQRKADKEQNELERQFRKQQLLAELAAKLREEENRQRVTQTIQNEQQTRAEVAGMKKKQDFVNERQLQLMNEGVDPGEALFQARREIEGIELEPALTRQTSAANLNQLNRGMAPTMAYVGETRNAAEGAENQARQAENLLKTNIAKNRTFSAPKLALEQDEEGIAKARLGATTAGLTEKEMPDFLPKTFRQQGSEADLKSAQAQAAIPGTHELVQAQQAAEQAKAQQASKEAAFETSALGYSDPKVAGEIRNYLPAMKLIESILGSSYGTPGSTLFEDQNFAGPIKEKVKQILGGVNAAPGIKAPLNLYDLRNKKSPTSAIAR